MRSIPFFKLDSSGNEAKYVLEALQSGWLTTGPFAARFEKQFQAMTGAQHTLAVNSCTSALHLALDALGVKAGDKVLVPTWTFTATAEVLRYLGADPVIVDVEHATGLLRPEMVSKTLAEHPQLKGVMAVHFAGHPAELVNDTGTGIAEICKANGLFLIEDAAHSFPTKLRGRLIGSFGDVTCFSFYANKTITTGEGGMLTTNNSELFKRTKLMRLHGINRDVWDRFTNSKAAWEYDVVAPGFKYNLPDLNAAIGLAQLERVEELRMARQKCAEIYLQRLGAHERIEVIHPTVPAEDHAWHLFPVYLRDTARISRNEVIEKLNARGVSTSVHYKPLHRLQYYRETYNLQAANYPVAERMWQTCLTIPLYAGMSEEDVHYVCDTLLDIVENPAR